MATQLPTGIDPGHCTMVDAHYTPTEANCPASTSVSMLIVSNDNRNTTTELTLISGCVQPDGDVDVD